MKTSKIILGIVAITIFACSTKKNATSSSTKTDSYDTQLTAIKGRYADVTVEELKLGHSVSTGACTNCHGQKDVKGYTEESLFKILDNMAKKAEISDKEKQALVRYCVAVRATNTK
ncbi:MAG: cytochrome c [Bacteroidetes bacterium]|jgi:hypothetical protein|nr:cytochrome c [Bacteroidota bacterium]